MPIRTVALLAGTVQDPYGGLCIEAYRSVVRERGARLVVFANCSPKSAGSADPRGWQEAVFQAERYDGLIILGSLCHGLGPDRFGEWCRSFSPVPTVTVSVAVPGLPAVVSDAAPGLSALLSHLADEHGYRDFALICGPPGQEEAEERKTIVMGELDKRGIRLDPEAIVHGDFTRDSARAAMESILSARGSPPRAVLCMNDDMARGAREMLIGRGYCVPDDVAVTGYDDFHSDDLCTVSQALREQSRLAAAELFDLIDGKIVPELLRVPSNLVRRGSCGCPLASLGPQEAAPQASPPAPPGASDEGGLSFSYRRRARELIKAAVELLDPGSEDDVFMVLERHLPELGISRCWLSLPAGPGEDESQLVLRLAMGGSGRVPLPAEGIPFPAERLRPEGFSDADGGEDFLVAETLVAGQRALGFLLMAPPDEGSWMWGSLGSLVTSALGRLRLLEERRRTEQQMMQSERMAELGALVAGVAHEINTPVGIGVTAASDLAARCRDVTGRYRANSLSKAEFERFLEYLEEESRLIEANLLKAGNLIRSFKQIAVDQANEAPRWFSLGPYLEDVLRSLSPRFKHGGHSYRIECPEPIELWGPPGSIAQIITNIVSNAVFHGFGERRGGKVKIRAWLTSRAVILEVQDDGEGIAPEHMSRLFQPFFTTKPGLGGAGLGLNIVYNLVRGIWKGMITCESHVHIGTVFRMEFPLPEAMSGGEGPRG